MNGDTFVNFLDVTIQLASKSANSSKVTQLWAWHVDAEKGLVTVQATDMESQDSPAEFTISYKGAGTKC